MCVWKIQQNYFIIVIHRRATLCVTVATTDEQRHNDGSLIIKYHKIKHTRKETTVSIKSNNKRKNKMFCNVLILTRDET